MVELSHNPKLWLQSQVLKTTRPYCPAPTVQGAPRPLHFFTKPSFLSSVKSKVEGGEHEDSKREARMSSSGPPHSHPYPLGASPRPPPVPSTAQQLRPGGPLLTSQ